MAAGVTLHLLAGAIPGIVFAEVPAADSPAFFAEKISPLLTTHCVACHGPEQQEGGLRLDSLAGLSAGGESGPVIVPGSAAESVLAGAVGYADEALAMPPDGKLSDEAIQAIRAWIDGGAHHPEIVSQVQRAAGLDAG